MTWFLTTFLLPMRCREILQISHPLNWELLEYNDNFATALKEKSWTLIQPYLLNLALLRHLHPSLRFLYTWSVGKIIKISVLQSSVLSIYWIHFVLCTTIPFNLMWILPKSKTLRNVCNYIATDRLIGSKKSPNNALFHSYWLN